MMAVRWRRRSGMLGSGSNVYMYAPLRLHAFVIASNGQLGSRGHGHEDVDVYSLSVNVNRP
jgi:hypothetical protein